MRVLKQAVQWLALLAMVEQARATTVQRCVGTAGELTFTYAGCPGGLPWEPYLARNPPPGSGVPASPPGAPRAPAQRQPSPTAQAARQPERTPTAKKTAARKKKPVKYVPWRQ